MPVLEHAIQRVHQAVAERVGVHVEWRVDEVRHIGPIHTVVRREVEGRSQALRLHLHPKLADSLRHDLARPPLVVQQRLELVERGLPHDRVQHVLDLARQHDAPPLRVGFGGQQRAERHHLAEHARGLRQRQRRAGHQVAVLRRQHLVHAMAQLVRQGHDIPRLAVVVHQQVRMHRRHGRMGERATRLAVPQPGIDPGMIEKALPDVAELLREAAIGRQHAVPRLRPGNRPVNIIRQRRVAVPVLQLLEAEPLRLQCIIPMRQPAIIRRHRRAERVHNLVLHHVRPVARAGGTRVVAPGIDDLFVLGQRVGHQREQPYVALEHLADRRRRIGPH